MAVTDRGLSKKYEKTLLTYAYNTFLQLQMSIKNTTFNMISAVFRGLH